MTGGNRVAVIHCRFTSDDATDRRTMKRRLAMISILVHAAATAAMAQTTTPSSGQPIPPVVTITNAQGNSQSANLTPTEAAFRDAQNALRRDVLQAPFSTELTIGQAARKLAVTEAVDATLQSARQPGGPRWRNEICELQLELPGTDLAAIIADAGRAKPQALGLTRDAFERRIAHLSKQRFTAIGLGRENSETRPGVAAMARPPVEGAAAMENPIPRNPPDWINRQIDAEGQGSGGGLRGARAGEAVALSQLREQVGALKLASGKTVGQAMADNPRINGAVTEALRRARVSRVEYASAMVTVRVSLDLDYVWRALTALE